MPNSPFKSLAHEAPILRAKVRLADGRIEQLTVSATFTPDVGTFNDPAVHRLLSDAMQRFMDHTGFGTKLLRLEALRSIQLEIGS